MDHDTSRETLSRPAVVCGLAVFCCLLWGSAFPSIKSGYALFQIAAEDWQTQLLFAGLRFTLAGLMVIAAGSLTSRRFLVPAAPALRKIAVLSLLQTVVQYTFFYLGLAHASGVTSSILGSSSVFFSILLASLLFHMEKVTVRKIAGCLIGFAGVVTVNLFQAQALDAGFHLNGEGFILISSLSCSLAAIMMKRYSAGEDPRMLTGWQFLLGGLILSAFGLAAGGRIRTVSAPGLVLLLYLGFISAAAYTIWSILLKYNPVSGVTIYGFTNPVFGVILSGLILGEAGQAFSVKNLLALGFVCAGIWLVNSRTAE